ncbi:MAG: hypothetical protein SCM96_11995 [Acidobacteriota bacterium]|nr:hypothetical protein [Acidobacteriota bacterium]
MKKIQKGATVLAAAAAILLTFSYCRKAEVEIDPTVRELRDLGMKAELISTAEFRQGRAPKDFVKRAGADYKPSFNEDPAIPAQCWIETGYGTQNACLYCHTDYLTKIGHGNAFPLGEDQVLYSFPSPSLNHILWKNVIFPGSIDARLKAEGVPLPEFDDTAYVRADNWRPAFLRARAGGNMDWMNMDDPDDEFALFPALDPNHLFPYDPADPTSGGTHGYIDPEGFVRDEKDGYTGWRAYNFFPYGIFTPLTGSVSGVYIRLPGSFMSAAGAFDIEIYKKNLDLLERNIKDRAPEEEVYYGDASGVPVERGFYPVGAEIAHPLHYVDLNADGERGYELDGAEAVGGTVYEFPGTRSKRVKEIRYMYKWKPVTLADIAPPDDEDDEEEIVIGREGQGWVDNGAGWILSAYIENRKGELRTQTTEELMQCIGCHGNVGNTIDSVWSFTRKLPGEDGWREMDYGRYDSRRPDMTRLQDFEREDDGRGELEYFYHAVVGADLYGVMPAEISAELKRYAKDRDLVGKLGLAHGNGEIFDDEALKTMAREERESRLRARQAVMRDYAAAREYLAYDKSDDAYYIKGSIFYPFLSTMKANIQLYRKIVLDQSYNLGKDVFGTEPGHVPFTFRSDGTVLDASRKTIAAGEVIASRPYGEDGVGVTPTGLVAVNADGVPVDKDGNPVDIEEAPERAAGHVSTGGTFDTMYNPILTDRPVRKKK